MLADLKLKPTNGKGIVNSNLKLIVNESSHLSSNQLTKALSAFIGTSNLLQPKAEEKNDYSYLNKRNIVFQSPPKTEIKEKKKADKKIPKIDIFKYPFNSLVEANGKL
jgi:hypothetical protein